MIVLSTDLGAVGRAECALVAVGSLPRGFCLAYICVAIRCQETISIFDKVTVLVKESQPCQFSAHLSHPPSYLQ